MHDFQAVGPKAKQPEKLLTLIFTEGFFIYGYSEQNG